MLEIWESTHKATSNAASDTYLPSPQLSVATNPPLTLIDLLASLPAVDPNSVGAINSQVGQPGRGTIKLWMSHMELQGQNLIVKRLT